MITQQKWKEKYGKFVWAQIDTKAYKKSLKQLKTNIFKKELVSKKDKRSIVISNKSQDKFELSANDKKMINLIRNNMKEVCFIPKGKEKMFMAAQKVLCTMEQSDRICAHYSRRDIKAVHSKSGEPKLYIVDIQKIFHVIREESALQRTCFAVGKNFDTQYYSRLEYRDRLQKQYNECQDYDQALELKASIDNINKRVRADNEKNITWSDAWDIYRLMLNSKKLNYRIEISYDVRKIASQSTDTPWSSCMNLNSGENLRYVPTGIAAGSFVAYAMKGRQEIARVLCKPYVSMRGKEVVYKWLVSKLYWNSGKVNDKGLINDFPYKVQDYLDTIYKPAVSKYTSFAMVPKVYNDREAFVVTQDGQDQDDRELYEEISDKLEIKDFNNFETYIKTAPDRIMGYLRDNYGYFSERNNQMVYVQETNWAAYLDWLKISYSKELAAYIEVFEDVCFGDKFHYESIVNILNNEVWYCKLKDLENLYRTAQFSERYSKLLNARKANFERILEKYDVTKGDFAYFVTSYFNDWNIIRHRVGDVSQNDSGKIKMDDLKDHKTVMALKQTSPDKYNRIKEYIDEYYFEGQDFEQNWDD